jgi:hypothetical protein
LLSDIITYIRRIVKAPSNALLTDNLIVDYINRFWILDVDARIQLFDLKTKYQFQTIPGISDYNMPLYSSQTSSPNPSPPLQDTISPLPVYQGFFGPAAVDGIQIPFYTQRQGYWNLWPNYIQELSQVATGDGTTTTFQFSLPYFPAIPGHIDMVGIQATGNTADPIFANEFSVFASPDPRDGQIAIPSTSFFPAVYINYTNENGSNTTISDSGQFLLSGTGNQLYGLLMQPGNPPFGNLPLGVTALNPGGTYSTTQNTVNYNSGVVNITFPNPPGAGTPIQAQCYFFEQGIPRAVLFWNNCLTIRPPPDTQYLIELDAYLTPAAFLSTTQAIPFAYMSEYVARGAARKILSDTGDVEQFAFYEPLFKEQETLVWKRSQRQFTSTRTGTIFSELQGSQSFNSGVGQGAT